MLTAWDDIKVLHSSDDRVAKFVFTRPDAVAETVLYRYPSYVDRTVICCSTMSGCPIGCRFCGAGDHFVRRLDADEIMEQVSACLQATGVESVDRICRLQIMFMSMGEPMLNWREVASAIKRLHELYPRAELLISTMGPDVDFMPLVLLSQRIDQVGLQFSIHESTNARRADLIPYRNKMLLEEIAATGTLWAAATGRQAFFNYCVHENNISYADADRLRELFDPRYWQATVSVVCERDETVCAAHERQRDMTEVFANLLLARGFSVRVFDPAGQDDIGGGCGQLFATQQWIRQHKQPGVTV